MVRPTLNRWWITRCTQPLSCLLFAGGAWLSLQDFPGPFDWRRMVISTLLSPRDNPAGFGWIAVGIALSGLLLMPLGGWLHRVLRPLAPRAGSAVRASLATGGAGMMAIAAIADAPWLLRLHNFLAVLTFCSLLAGLLTTAALLVRHPQLTHVAQRGRGWQLLLLLALLTGPVVATIATQLAVFLSPLWEPGARVAMPPWLHIAFWEWILSVLIYAGGWALAWHIAPEGGGTAGTEMSPPPRLRHPIPARSGP